MKHISMRSNASSRVLAERQHSTEDDWYNGMFIPKGTSVLLNLWNCINESSTYGDNAKSFRPERYLDANGRAIPGPAETREEGHGTFGFGRRACVGKQLIQRQSWILGWFCTPLAHDNLTQALVLTWPL